MVKNFAITFRQTTEIPGPVHWTDGAVAVPNNEETLQVKLPAVMRRPPGTAAGVPNLFLCLLTPKEAWGCQQLAGGKHAVAQTIEAADEHVQPRVNLASNDVAPKAAEVLAQPAIPEEAMIMTITEKIIHAQEVARAHRKKEKKEKKDKKVRKDKKDAKHQSLSVVCTPTKRRRKLDSSASSSDDLEHAQEDNELVRKLTAATKGQQSDNVFDRMKEDGTNGARGEWQDETEASILDPGAPPAPSSSKDETPGVAKVPRLGLMLRRHSRRVSGQRPSEGPSQEGTATLRRCALLLKSLVKGCSKLGSKLAPLEADVKDVDLAWTLGECIHSISRGPWLVVDESAAGGTSGALQGTPNMTAQGFQLRELQRLNPADFEVLSQLEITTNKMKSVVDIVTEFRSARTQGCWAMYKNESLTVSTVLKATMENDELGLICVSALALTGEDGF
jgi:hypothetical protein